MASAKPPGVFAIGDVRSASVKRVAAAVGEGAQVVTTLHAFLVDAGADHARAESRMEARHANDCAMEAFNIAFDDVYGQPPLSKDALQHLDASYAARAEKDVALQSRKAGIRLAAVLNRLLGKQLEEP